MKYCAEGKSGRFGIIEFAVGIDVTEEFNNGVREVPEADWQTLYRHEKGELLDTGQQYAEVCFVPNWVGHKKDGPTYRYPAIREPVEQPALPGMEDQMTLPFPIMDWGAVRYKVTGIVMNSRMGGDEVIWWYRGRCGKSEEAHAVMKEDLAGGKLPSHLFGVNAAWRQIMIVAFNVNWAMKRLVLGESWVRGRLKAIRFRLIRLPGRVLEHGRRLFVRLAGGHPSNELVFEARRRMACLCDSG
ncbi:MAG: transposase [Desulfomonile sp.]|nr:transposase [Desulfomonile sp.]